MAPRTRANQHKSFRRHLQLLMDIDEERQQDEDKLMSLFLYDLDKEAMERTPIVGRIPNKDRGAFFGHHQLMADYLNDDPVYSDADFECWFRVTKRVFFRLCNDLQTKNLHAYFIQQPVSFFLTNHVYLKPKLMSSNRMQQVKWAYRLPRRSHVHYSSLDMGFHLTQQMSMSVLVRLRCNKLSKTSLPPSFTSTWQGTYKSQQMKTSILSSMKTRLKAFQAAWAAWTVCMLDGRTAQPLGPASSQEKRRNQLSYLRQSQQRIDGSGTASLVYREQTTTSMFFLTRLSLMMFSTENHQQSHLKSTKNNSNLRIIYAMASICHGNHSSSPSPTHRT